MVGDVRIRFYSPSGGLWLKPTLSCLNKDREWRHRIGCGPAESLARRTCAVIAPSDDDDRLLIR
jgi:hypothetical protein